MTLSHPVHTGMRPKRYATPDFANPIPDALYTQDENGTTSMVVNPKWEAAPYEEVIVWKDRPRGKKSNPKPAFYKSR